MVHAACVSHHIAARVGTMAILALTLFVSVPLVATRAILLVVATEAILLVVATLAMSETNMSPEVQAAIRTLKEAQARGELGNFSLATFPAPAGPAATHSSPEVVEVTQGSQVAEASVGAPRGHQALYLSILMFRFGGSYCIV